MKYFLDDNWVNDSTINVLPNGATELNDSEWDNRQSEPAIPTAEDIANAYKMERRQAYPAIGDQLDMIFHAGLGGDEFQAAIQAVKDANPKT